MRPDPDGVSQGDLAPDHAERVDGAVASRCQTAGQVGVGGDVALRAQLQLLVLDRGQFADEALLTEGPSGVACHLLLQLELALLLDGAALSPEEPRGVIEGVGVERCCSVVAHSVVSFF